MDRSTGDSCRKAYFCQAGHIIKQGPDGRDSDEEDGRVCPILDRGRNYDQSLAPQYVCGDFVYHPLPAGSV